MDRIEKRRRWMVRRRLDGWKIDEIAEALRVSEKTVDRWCGIHRKHGWEGLRIKPRAPHTYWRTPQETVELILRLRREWNWGPCKIEGYLKNYGGESVVAVGHNAIHRILIQAGLNNPIQALRKTWGKRRFERPYGNNLWQSDFKMTMDDEWMISFLDDHSRYVPGSEIHYNLSLIHI